MADSKQHDPFPPAHGPGPKRAPAAPHAPAPSIPPTVTRGETSPTKTARKSTGDH